MQENIYYHNFPFELSSTIVLDNEIIESTALGRTKVPSIVYIGQGKEFSLDNIKHNLNKHLLKETGIEIYLFEWFRYYSDTDKTVKEYNELEYNDQLHTELRTPVLDVADKFAREEEISITVHCCEYNTTKYIFQNYPNLTLRCLDFQNQTESIGYKYNAELFKPKNEIKYKFWCSANRFTNHRHLLMCYLADKPGKYIWPFSCNNICEDITWLKTLPWSYLKEGNKILNQTDFFIDNKIDKIVIENYKFPKIANFPWTWDGNLENFLKSFEDSFAAIVTESVFFQPTATITEKTFNSIVTLTPFIMIGAPFTLQYLKKLGFKTFDKWWDESYDEETDHAERLLKIFKLIDYINSLSNDQLHCLYKEMYSVLDWNRNHLLSLHSRDIILP